MRKLSCDRISGTALARTRNPAIRPGNGPDAPGYIPARAGGREPVLRHRDRGIPGPDRPGRALAHGPPDEHAGIRGVRPVLPPSAAHSLGVDPLRQCPANGLEQGHLRRAC